jgi:predicted ribosome quality control (RQC) complex YloA/Tae2 family protein
LTYKEFSKKLRDLLEHEKIIKMSDIELLKIGRHFRFDKNKIIVGRNEEENEKLLKQKRGDDYYFEVSDFMGPITLLQGLKMKEAIRKAAALTVRYSDAKGRVKVEYGKKRLDKSLIIDAASEEEIKKLRIN